MGVWIWGGEKQVFWAKRHKRGAQERLRVGWEYREQPVSISSAEWVASGKLLKLRLAKELDASCDWPGTLG